MTRRVVHPYGINRNCSRGSVVDGYGFERDRDAVLVFGDHGTTLADNPHPDGQRFGKEGPLAELAGTDTDNVVCYAYDRLVAWLETEGDQPVPDEYDERDGGRPDWFSPYFQRPTPE